MTRFASMTIALLLLLQLLVAPFTFAQTGEQESEVPSTPEMEVCSIPWEDYKIFTNYRLNYQAAIANEEPVFAQDLFESMQDVLFEHCDAIASIIQVKSDGVDAECNDLVNHLVAKNNYYVRALDADNAVATQGLIQRVLLAQDCTPILAPDSEVAIELIQEDIAAQQTIDLGLEVIPYTNNVCFNTYGPSHTFKQQVDNIQDPVVATSVFDAVSNYFNQLSAGAADAIQQQREGTLLAYAKNLLGFKKDALLYNPQYNDTVLPFQVAEFVEFANGLTTADGLQESSAFLAEYLPSFADYIGQLSQLDLRTSLQEPRIHNLVNSLVDTPIVLVRDDVAQTFTRQELQEGDRGLSFVFPALTQQVVDPADPENTIQETIRSSMELKVIDIEGSGVMVEEENDETGALEMVEEYSVSKLVAEIYYADAKIAALDISLQYNAAMDVVTAQGALYMDPYIVTSDTVITRDVDVAGNEVTTTAIDFRFFGPGGCDVLLDATFTDRQDAQGKDIQDQTFVLTLNNTRVEVAFANVDKMFDDIKLHRKNFPTATSAPTTIDHVVFAKIFHKNYHRADVYPLNDQWRIEFTDGTLGKRFINDYRNPAIMDSPVDTTTVTTIRDIIKSMRDGGEVQVDKIISGCTDRSAQNYNVEATLDDGSCTFESGYGSGDERPVPEAGTGDAEGYGYGSGDETPSPETGTGDEGGSGYQEIPGCMDPLATNYNPEANFDDGSCTLPPAGPVYGCMEPGALNYNPNATIESGDCDWGAPEQGGGRW